MPGVKSLKFDAQPLAADKCDVRASLVAPYWSRPHARRCRGAHRGAAMRS